MSRETQNKAQKTESEPETETNRQDHARTRFFLEPIELWLRRARRRAHLSMSSRVKTSPKGRWNSFSAKQIDYDN